MHMFLYPEIKATDFRLKKDRIIFTKENGEVDSYIFFDIRNLTINYQWRGIHVRAQKTVQYSLPFEPKIIEQKLDSQKYFYKQITFMNSKEGNIRTVWYGNVNHGAENKSFTVGNKNLPKSLFSNEDLENNKSIIEK